MNTLEVSQASRVFCTTLLTFLPMIPYGRQWINEDDINAVKEALCDDLLTRGKRIPIFEEGLRLATGAPHAMAVSSGTAALHLCCAALPINRGITSPITFLASANCLFYVGAQVHFADVDPRTGLLDPNSVEETLKKVGRNPNDKGIVISVSLNGQVADLPRIQTLAKNQGWYTIEDAAHSLGGTYQNANKTILSASCQHSDFAILSFHPLKHICTAEGGAVTTASDALAQKIRLLRSHGINYHFSPDKQLPGWYTEQTELGWNYRLTDLQAALGTSQLKRLSLFLQRRRQLANRYRSLLNKPPFTDVFSLLPDDPGHAYHLFVIHFKEEKIRNDAYTFLKERQIQTQVNYRPLYKHPYYQERLGNLYLPGAEAYFKGCLSIPLFPKMTEAEQDRVCEAIQAFCATLK